jgi:hypothetical protein
MLDAAMTSAAVAETLSVRVGQADDEGRNSVGDYPPNYALELEAALETDATRTSSSSHAPFYTHEVDNSHLHEVSNHDMTLTSRNRAGADLFDPTRRSSFASTESLPDDVKASTSQHPSRSSSLHPASCTRSLQPPNYTPSSRPASVRSSKSKATAKAVGKVAYNLLDTTLRLPVDIAYNAARGYHNAPRLYGDKTVRPTPEITGLASGTAAAASGLALGLYDAVSGLVTQPYTGYRDNGVLGAVKGVGKAIGGAYIKPVAAVIEAPAYLLKGIHAAVMDRKGGWEGRVIMARRVQGFKDAKGLTEEGREGIVKLWRTLVEERDV